MIFNLRLSNIRIILLIFILVPSIYSAQTDNEAAEQRVYELLYLQNYSEAKSLIDAKLKSPTPEEQLVGYFWLSEYYAQQHLVEQQFQSLQTIRTLSEKTSSKEYEGYLAFAMARFYSGLQHNNKVSKYVNVGIRNFEKAGLNTFNISRLYQLDFNYKGQNTTTEKERKSAWEATEFALSSGNKWLTSTSLMLLSDYYHDQYQLTKQSNYLDSIDTNYKKINFYTSLIPNDKLKTIVSTESTLQYYKFKSENNLSWDIDQAIFTMENLLNQVKYNVYNHSSIVDMMNLLATLYIQKKDYSKSLNYYKEAYAIHVDNPNFFKTLKGLATLNELLNNPKEALLWNNRANEFLNKSNETSKLERAKRWQLINQLPPLDIDKMNYTLNDFRAIFIGIFLLIVGILTGKYIIKSRGNAKKNNYIKLEKQQRISLLKLQFNRKGEFYNFLKFTNKKSSEKDDNDKTLYESKVTEHKHHLEKHLQNNSTLINIHHILREESEPQKKSLLQPSTIVPTHPELYQNLNQLTNSKLTHLDLKYASYIFMNMNNSEIASLLNVEAKTVRMTKYRLKQKLGLTKEDDLTSFIMDQGSK